MKPYSKNIFFLSFIILISTNANAQLIQHVTIIDGSGKKGFKSAIRIKESKIVSVGNILPYKGEKIIDGRGMVLAPGFIDSHSHHFGALMQHPAGIPNASQGVTTIVIGQDGESYLMDSLRAMINRQPIAINVATYTGHSTLREMVMGEHDVLRKATAAEIDKMKLLLNDDLQKGSLGLSTGLEYEQAFYSSKEEVIDLAKIAALNHTRYISHIRSEDVTIDDAMDEIISIGRITKMPVQISHLKIGIKDKWNSADLIIKKLEAARAEGINITADVYPYNFWNSTLRVLFAKRDYENLASAQFAVDQVFDANESYLVQFAPQPSYKGKTISVIARERNESPAQTIIELIKMVTAFKKANPNYEGSVEAIAAKGMNEKDVANFIAWPYSNICSDGKDGGHPRGYGTFTKVLSKYTREDRLLLLEEAIHKMTGLTAAHLGIENRGIIKEGNFADLVLFDPKTVKDNATIQDSKALSDGIRMVWVNGQLIYQKKKPTGKLPGTLITSKKIVMNNAIVLTNGLLKSSDAKTAHGLIRGTERFTIIGVIDNEETAGQDAGILLDGKHKNIPVFASFNKAIEELNNIHFLVIGVATVGGRLPGNMLEIIIEAIKRGISIVNGLHEYLSEKPVIVELAKNNKVQLIDVRKPKTREQLHFWTGEIFKVQTPIIAVIGMDCAMGKRTTARMLKQACEEEGINAQMIYTGQTGWLQGGKYGFIFDSTLNDFVSGELEHAIVSCANETKANIIFLEGQSSLRNPSGPCGIELLISGNAKHTILLFAPKRKYFDNDPHWGIIPSVASEIELIEKLGSKVIAVAMNTEDCTIEEAYILQKEYTNSLGIPVLLPIHEGVTSIISTLKELI